MKKYIRRASCIVVLSAWASLANAQSLPDDSLAARWRVASRLGYGVSASLDQAAFSSTPSAQKLALQWLIDAQKASKSPPNLPEQLSKLKLSAAQVSAQFHEEREARKTVKANADPAQLDPFSREMAQGAAAWRLAACSRPELEAPLLARMTEFWFNHFNVFVGKGVVRPYVASYLLEAIRPNALGKFEDLLLATAQHPAMLLYLDQAQSSSRGLNENYARELMELHTLGVRGGYSQSDVRELARVLTGWSVDIPGGQAFFFRPRAHEAGLKTVMGQSFSSGGQNEGVEAIRFLARHPATAQRISARLASFFVADAPPQALIDRLAETFTQTQGDIAAVMRSLIESPQFWQTQNTLVKTPLDYACSALAAAGSSSEAANNAQNIRQALGFLAVSGQPMHGWQTPDGYKTDAATWLAPEALTRRADFAFGLAPRVTAEPSFLTTYYSAATREIIAKEVAPLTRSGLLLTAPEFMRK